MHEPASIPAYEESVWKDCTRRFLRSRFSVGDPCVFVNRGRRKQPAL